MKVVIYKETGVVSIFGEGWREQMQIKFLNYWITNMSSNKEQNRHCAKNVNGHCSSNTDVLRVSIYGIGLDRFLDSHKRCITGSFQYAQGKVN